MAALAGLIAGPVGCDQGSAAPESVPALRILWQSGLASRTGAWGCPARPVGGLARAAAEVARLRARGEAPLFFDVGETLVPELPTGEAVASVRQAFLQQMAGAALDGWLPGEKDLLSTGDFVTEVVRRYQLPVVLTNVVPRASPSAFARWRILERGPHRIGLIGLLLSRDHQALQAAGFTLEEPLASARLAVAEMKPRPDFVVALVRSDGPLRTVRAALDGLTGVSWMLLAGYPEESNRVHHIGGATALASFAPDLTELAFHLVDGSPPVYQPEVGELGREVRRLRADLDRADGLFGLFAGSSQRRRADRLRQDLEQRERLVRRLTVGLTGRSWVGSSTIRLDVPAPSELAPSTPPSRRPLRPSSQPTATASPESTP